MIEFYYSELIYWVFFIAFIWAYLYWSYERNFWRWIKDYWNCQPHFKRRLSSLCYFLSIILLFSALLRPFLSSIKYNQNYPLPDLYALIIDQSLSMNSEDIHPSRSLAAIHWSQNFVKEVGGGTWGVWRATEQIEKIVPLTQDIDLVSSRLSFMEATSHTNSGGSEMDKAIWEVVQELNVVDQIAKAHIIVITDGEQHSSRWLEKLPDGYSLSFVIVGKEEGAPIPYLDQFGKRQWKMSEGQKVISRANFHFGEKWQKYSPYLYSTTIDSDPYGEKTYGYIQKITPLLLSKLQSADFTRYFVLVALLLLILSILLKWGKIFKILVFVFLWNTHWVSSAKANEDHLLNLLQQGKIGNTQRWALAESLQKKDPQKALLLYEEILGNNWPFSSESDHHLFNFGTLLMANYRLDEGEKVYQILLDRWQRKTIPSTLLWEKKRAMQFNRLEAIERFLTLKKTVGKQKKESGSSFIPENFDNNFWDKWKNEDRQSQERFWPKNQLEGGPAVLNSKDW